MLLNNLKKILLLMLLYGRTKWKEKARKRRNFWAIFAKGAMPSEYHHLFPDLLSGDKDLRINPEWFKPLLSLVKDKISWENKKFRSSISPGERLVLAIRFLATGTVQWSLSFAFRIGKTAASNILRETSEAIYNSLKNTYLRVPSSTSE